MKSPFSQTPRPSSESWAFPLKLWFILTIWGIIKLIFLFISPVSSSPLYLSASPEGETDSQKPEKLGSLRKVIWTLESMPSTRRVGEKFHRVTHGYNCMVSGPHLACTSVTWATTGVQEPFKKPALLWGGPIISTIQSQIGTCKLPWPCLVVFIILVLWVVLKSVLGGAWVAQAPDLLLT